MKNKLWVEKYRPNNIDDYVFKDENQKFLIESWIQEKSIPHLLFSGSPGVGKTTLAKILIEQLDVEEADVLYANGSKEARKIEWVDYLISFCQTMPFGDFKIVLIDEADYMNIQSVQPALRNLMEDYSNSVRFILTCNYPNRIIPQIHSRSQGFHIEKTDVNEFTARVATVLVSEDIEFDLDTLDTYVKSTYPDLRKCLNNCQMNSKSGKLLSFEKQGSSADWKYAVVELLKERRITDARKLICASVRQDEMEEMFRWCYDNLDLWGDDQETQDNAIKIIRDGAANHTLVADYEINLSAMMVELTSLRK